MPDHSPDRLWQALEARVLVLTASRRLCRDLQRRYAQWQCRRGRDVWPSPYVMPWQDWIAQCWLELDLADQALLSPGQEQALWEEIVAGGETPRYPGGLLQVSAAARNARDAWRLLRAWRLQLPLSGESLNEDVQAFAGWAMAFSARCRPDGWVDRATLAGRIAGAGAEKPCTEARQILLAGFDEFTPQQEHLWQALRAEGIAVETLRLERRPAVAQRVVAADAEQELVAAAHWARYLLEQRVAGAVGIVVPDLDRQRARVERVFEDVLTPGAVLGAASDPVRAFNISLGRPLAQVPVVYDAMDSLALAAGNSDLAQISHLLRSPYLAGADGEASARALLDARLRARAERRLRFAKLCQAVAHERAHCPVLAQRLALFSDALPAVDQRLPLREWSRVFSDLLLALGWPGDRGLDSVEHQAVEALRAVLDELAALDPILKALRYGRALAWLRQALSEHIFQPESAESPVQILGVLEAAGLEFSHLWVVGMNDESWPPAPRPNPFLPVHLQQRLGMPHASAERELAFSRRITERLLHSAEQMVLSHPAFDGDRPLRPSPLIAHIAEVTLASVGQARRANYARDMNEACPRLEVWHDEQGPALDTGTTAAGGARIFTDQSLCPFRAFALHRLGADALEMPGPGLDPRVRGSVVHEILARLWADLRTHAGLIALDAQALREQVGATVASVLRQYARDHGETLRGRFLRLEHERIVQLMLAWLVVDRERPPFEVLAPEQEKVARVAGLPVRIRPDRVDRLADGRHLLIDYKTGAVNPAHWFGARPDDAQMPVYVMAHDAPVAGVGFARLQRGELRYAGLAADAHVAPGLQVPGQHRRGSLRQYAGWEQVLRSWGETLARLATEFSQGQARVEPKRPTVCDRCHLLALCRLHEQAGWQFAAHDDGGERHA